jgi:hypothetical protein
MSFLSALTPRPESFTIQVITVCVARYKMVSNKLALRLSRSYTWRGAGSPFPLMLGPLVRTDRSLGYMRINENY